MPQLLDFIGGPCAGKHPIEGEPPPILAIAQSPSQTNSKPFDQAAYRLDQSNGVPQYHFLAMARLGKLHGGPLNDQQQIFIGNLPMPVEARVQGPTGKLTGIFRYELRDIDENGAATVIATAEDFLEN